MSCELTCRRHDWFVFSDHKYRITVEQAAEQHEHEQAAEHNSRTIESLLPEFSVRHSRTRRSVTPKNKDALGRFPRSPGLRFALTSFSEPY